MYSVVLYTDAHGNCPVKDFRQAIQLTGGKQARVQLQQMERQVLMLQEVGTWTQGGCSRHVRGKIWELKPGNNRIMFFHWKDDIFVLLHAFRKTTNQTPASEIEQAEREAEDWLARHGN